MTWPIIPSSYTLTTCGRGPAQRVQHGDGVVGHVLQAVGRQAAAVCRTTRVAQVEARYLEPRSTSAARNSSDQWIICVPAPPISSIGASVDEPKVS